MPDFNELWQFVVDRSQRGVMTVQEKSELEHVYNLMKGCDCQSYLEVGTAEGNSLYVLGSIPKYIGFIDLYEDHTLDSRNEVIGKFDGRRILGYPGDSTNPNTHPRDRKYDCVLIDGGHDFATVLSDSILYAPLATKYIFWHDIQLPEVKAAVEWFVKRWKLGKYSTFINSTEFGFGICEVGK